MKKLICLLVLVSTLFLTGCEASEKDRDELLNALKRDKIVDKKLEQIDYIVDIYAGVIPSRTTYYVYENEDKELIAISYESIYSSNKDYDYLITIYHDVTLNESYTTITDDEAYVSEDYYIYEDGTKSSDEKYTLDNKKVYEVTEKTSFIFKKLVVEEVTE